MVGGMSGKSGEPRRGQAARSKAPVAISKPQPSVEAIQMAKILGDQHPSDLTDKVQQIRAVVPGRSEEEISVALHDHDFDCDKAITALLDSGSTQGVWTTSGRKGKKKGGSDLDFIVVPGDTKPRSSGRNTGSGTSKAASLSTRENYGGSAHLSGEGGRNRGQGRAQSSGRGRSSSSGRRDRPRDSRSSGRTGRANGSKEKERPVRTRTPQTSIGSSNTAPSAPVQPTQVDWGAPQPLLQQTEVWASTSSPTWDSKEPVSTELDPQWEADETTPIFPDAIPPTSTLLPLASTAESTSLTATSTTLPESHTRQLLTPPAETRPSENVPVEMPPSKPPSTASRTRQRHKRIARSQIPTKAVEMPGGVDALDVEFGSLGIDFVGMEPQSAVEPQPVTSEAPPPSQYEASAQLQDSASLLTVQHFSDDPGVISMSGVSPVDSYQPPAPTQPDTKLEAPPGLSLPTEHQLSSSKPITLPQTHPSVSHSAEESTSAASLVPQVTTAYEEPPTLPLSTHTSLPPLSTEAPLPPLPQSIEMPRSTAAEPSTHIEQGSQQLASHSFSAGPSSTSGLQLLSSQPQAVSTGTTLTSSTGTRTSQSQHGGLQGKHSQQVPPNMMYQVPMQYPFGMMPVASPYYDPSDLSRYQQSVSVAPYYQQHPSSTDPSIVSGGITRDHGMTGFTAEGAKFGGRGTDVTSPASTNPTQLPSQHQQGALQQGGQLGAPALYPYFYPGSFMYPTMGMPAGFSAPSMGPKPTGGSGYPGVSSYQPMPNQGAFGIAGYEEMTVSGSAHDQFSRGMYGNSKASVQTASTGGATDLSSGFKHQQPYDGKSGSNYYMQGSTGGYMAAGGFMQAMPGMPMHHMPVVPPSHDLPQTRSQMQKHSKPSYGGGGLGWSQGSHAS